MWRWVNLCFTSSAFGRLIKQNKQLCILEHLLSIFHYLLTIWEINFCLKWLDRLKSTMEQQIKDQSSGATVTSLSWTAFSSAPHDGWNHFICSVFTVVWYLFAFVLYLIFVTCLKKHMVCNCSWPVLCVTNMPAASGGAGSNGRLCHGRHHLHL